MKRGESNLIAKARLLYASRLDVEPGQIWFLLRAIGADKLGIMDPSSDAGFYRFLGSLTEQQRNAWIGGKAVKASALSSESQRLLVRWMELETIRPTSFLRASKASELYPEVAPQGIKGAVLRTSSQYGAPIEVDLPSGYCCRPQGMMTLQ